MTMMRKTALATVALGVCLSFTACASLGGKPGGPSAPASANTTEPETGTPLSHLFGGGHAKKNDYNAHRADPKFRRNVDRLEVEAAPGADGNTKLSVIGRTYAEYSTERGPTEVEESRCETLRCRCGIPRLRWG